MNSIFAWLEASRNWLETKSRWSKLRDLGQSSMVRSSILMPVFGYLLLFNEDVRQYLRIGYDAAWPFNTCPRCGEFGCSTAGVLYLRWDQSSSPGGVPSGLKATSPGMPFVYAIPEGEPDN